MPENLNAGASDRSASAGSVTSVLLETVLVAVVGGALAFAANAISPRGLNLTRDNFPRPVANPSLWAATNTPPRKHSPNAGTGQAGLAERLLAEGMHLADTEQVLKLYDDPRRAQELVVFIDARSDVAYQGGHIPGAYQFDRYYPEKYIPNILNVCRSAEQVVVYCNGGNCEDSEFAAVMLYQWGIPKDKLWVYAGGIGDWMENHRPVEVGDRLSGNLRQ